MAFSGGLLDGGREVQRYTGLNGDNQRYLLGAGTYTLTVRGTASSNGTGAYEFALFNLPQATPAVFGEPVTLDLAKSTAAYRFDAESGEAFKIEARGGTNGGRFFVRDADGAEVASGYLYEDQGYPGGYPGNPYYQPQDPARRFRVERSGHLLRHGRGYHLRGVDGPRDAHD